MPLRTMLVQIDAGAASPARLEAALALAQHHGAHLTGLYMIAEPHIPSLTGLRLPADLVRQQRERSTAEAVQVLAEATVRARAARVDFEAIQDSATIDRLTDAMLRRCRNVDLVIVGQPEPGASGVDELRLVEAMFRESGRPALIVPFIGPRTMPPKRILCAWNGSREAVRALSDALPLMVAAESTTLMIVDPAKFGERLGTPPGADILAYLTRHGVQARIRTTLSNGLGIADVLLGAVSDEDADLLVMGAFGQARLRELVQGYATEHLLEHMTVPILFSH